MFSSTVFTSRKRDSETSQFAFNREMLKRVASSKKYYIQLNFHWMLYGPSLI
jgi:hypothetical protein